MQKCKNCSRVCVHNTAENSYDYLPFLSSRQARSTRAQMLSIDRLVVT